MENIFDYPNLGTYLLVTETIRKHGPVTLSELTGKLENKGKRSHVEAIVDYLYTKKQVDFDKEGKITWINR